MLDATVVLNHLHQYIIMSINKRATRRFIPKQRDIYRNKEIYTETRRYIPKQRDIYQNKEIYTENKEIYILFLSHSPIEILKTRNLNDFSFK